MNVNVKSMVKVAVYAAVVVGIFTAGAYADVVSPPDNSIGAVAQNVSRSFGAMGLMMSSISYLAGISFVIASVFKLKQHKDNPQQIPVTTGITMLALGIGMVTMPSVVGMGGATLFGKNAVTAGTSGFECESGKLGSGNCNMGGQ